MRKVCSLLFITLSVSACSGSVMEKQMPVCEATALLGGQPQTVHVYGVRKIASQTEYKAGYPFNWRWVNKNNFTRSACQ